MQVDRRKLLAAGAAAAALPIASRGHAQRPALPVVNISSDTLAATIERCRKLWGVPGLSVAIVRGDETLYIGGHGVRQYGAPAPVDADTLFQIGSTSKAFCAAAAGMLVDQGRLQWNDPIKKYLPNFDLGDHWLTENLTVTDALAHRTGRPGFWATATSVIDRDECFARMRREQPVGRFRDSFVYNNVMFGVMGAVIEAASGKSWHEFVTQHLFQPLGMRRTRSSPYAYWPKDYVTGTFLGTVSVSDLHYRHAKDGNVSMPHMLNDGRISVLPWQSYDNLAPAGSIVSCATDMAQWVKMHLANGRFADREILKPATARTMHARHNVAIPDAPGFDPFETGYGMGWIHRSYHGRTLVEHTGGIEGFPAYVGFMPEDQIGIVILANGFTSYKRRVHSATFPDGRPIDAGGLRKAISLTVIDLLLGFVRADWAEQLHADEVAENAARVAYIAQAPEKMTDQPGPPLPLRAFVGTFTDRKGPEGDVEITLRGQQLEFAYPGVGGYRARLVRHGNAIFLIDPVTTYHTADYVRIDVDDQGRATGFDAFNARFERV